MNEALSVALLAPYRLMVPGLAFAVTYIEGLYTIVPVDDVTHLRSRVEVDVLSDDRFYTMIIHF